ncbi:2'-5' RNA ligase family protein [Sphingomonas sp. DG1-23]|uniref:2'-5' RNA ligase family protein n=1 Tax=Sphingomonas sp. DG1-23 TaxID=3068316 RepID=UPI00273FAB53|nr:2'-5' RNA ligase family protein [Sphingomonas sp. DG1-23]MDP5277932.1 2'-5' RNA ligase family protein [Sphingomonas sp. DG1-23]
MSAPAPLIVTALFGRQDQAWFDVLRRAHYPPGRNLLDAHLTLFHHLPPSAGEELKQRLSGETRGIRAPRARVTGLMSLGGGVAYRIEAPELDAIRERLSDAFAGMLMPQDAGRWRPHVTVQNKVTPSLAKVVLGALSRDFRSREVEIAGLASWWYRGGPWEAHSRHMFA